ncbi:MAG TPA: acyl-CoA dehydratase activase [Spirochaetota bacterium]|nr:acyl-CoA dehydratase activase [Spirochaetota bacterium]
MVIGVDAGSKFLKIVPAGAFSDRNVSGTAECMLYGEHHGNPRLALNSMIAGMMEAAGSGAPGLRIVATGPFAGQICDRGAFEGADSNPHIQTQIIDEIAAAIEAVRYLGIECRQIVIVGAGSIRCIELDDAMSFRAYRENSLCAAGTGSFLDEQMRRMGFGYEDVAALPSHAEPPSIATRCAVFAKSDIIHRQQEGHTRDELWSGLCRGVVTTMLATAFRGDVPACPVLFCGGLFLNPQAREWVRCEVGRPVFHDRGHFLAAIGAALAGEREAARETAREWSARGGLPVSEGGGPSGCFVGCSPREGQGLFNDADSRVLALCRSKRSTINPIEEYQAEGNEVRVHRKAPAGKPLALGVDIGSTSTKCVVIDAESREVVCDIYRKTGGDPLGASGALFSALVGVLEDGARIERVATTGSGRRLVGRVMGASAIVNEITAHYRGATHHDPSIETVFEIGGQDAKYIRGSGGAVIDCNMNFVCAAGTGSFIEEQAVRLGYDVRDIGALTLGRRIPHTSDRCTVFMEQDIQRLLREGRSHEETLAGVLHSIAKNYLYRVVGTRPVTGERVFFQGATARNNGLVAAFELITGKEIVVSPHCHVMGALGAAIISLEHSDACAGAFRGLSVFERQIDIGYRACTDCANRCTITVARLEGGVEESWGYLCGRDEGECADYYSHPRGNSSPHEDVRHRKNTRPVNHLSRVRSMAESANAYSRPRKASHGCADSNRRIHGRRIGITQALSMHGYLPLWRTFLGRLGFDVALSGASTPLHKEAGIRIAKSDFCFPVKMALAHARELAAGDGVDALFFPTVISERRQESGLPRISCPYEISIPSLAAGTLGLPVPVIAPVVDFRLDERLIVESLKQALVGFEFGEEDVRQAYRAGLEAHHAHLLRRYEYGLKLLAKMREDGKKGIVFIGRPYNLYDPVINMGLPERFAGSDVEILPYECLMDPSDWSSNVHYMYWHYGERILAFSQKIRDMDGLYPVYLTNFGCGPDSFVLTRFEEIMKGKPYLIVELDEHGSDTGYLTRIEAFMDVVRTHGTGAEASKPKAGAFLPTWKQSDRKLWIPPMHEISARISAAGFRAWGFDAEALPVEDGAAHEVGRRGVRGSECLPASTTIGVFLRKMREIGADPRRHALFMPTAEGPCRFGQYTLLHRRILAENGFGQAEIFSPSSVNSYMGMPEGLRMYLWNIIISGDMLFKQICARRPYEREPGSVDRAAEEALRRVEEAAGSKSDLIAATLAALDSISRVPVSLVEKPLVGVVGEIYVRCNPYCNNDLVRAIESFGGEAWLTPISEWILYTAWMERHSARRNRTGFWNRTVVGLKTAYLFHRYHKFERAMDAHLSHRREPTIEAMIDYGKRFLPVEFEGEAILTLGRAAAFADDGAALVVNCAPFGCMPGNITNALFQGDAARVGRVAEHHGTDAYPRLHERAETFPRLLTLFYDGESDVNRMVGVYLQNIAAKDDDYAKREPEPVNMDEFGRKRIDVSGESMA